MPGPGAAPAAGGGHGGGGAAAIGLGGLSGLANPAAGIPQPNVFAALAEAAGQFPEQQRKAQAEKLELDQQKQALESSQLEAATKQMGLLARMARANTARAQDPAFVAKMQALGKTAGIPIPTNADGSIDLDSIPGSGGLMDMSPTEKLQFAGSPEAVRRSVWPGESESAYKAPVYLPPKDMDQIQREFSSQMQNAVKTGSISSLKAWLAGMGPSLDQLESAGRFSRTDLAGMLDDPSFQQSFAPVANARIAQYEALGLNETSLAKVRDAMLPENIANIKSMILRRSDETSQGNVRLAQGQQRIGIDEQRAQAQIMNANTNAANAVSNAQRAAAAVQDAQTKAAQFAAQPNPLAKARFDMSYKLAKAQNDTAQKKYEDLVKQVNTIITAAGPRATTTTGRAAALGDPDDKNSLSGQMKAAKEALDQSSSVIQQLSTQANDVSSNRMTAGSGKPTAISGGSGSSGQRMQSTSKSGRKIYSDDGGATWKYSQ